MPASPLERLRGSGEGRIAENRRPPTSDYRGEYDNLHTRYSPTYQPRDPIRSPSAPHYHTGQPPTGPRQQPGDRRQPLPVRSYDDRHPVDTSRPNERMREDRYTGRYGNLPDATRGGEAWRTSIAARSEHHNFNKRPTPSLNTTFENENPTKRQRYTPKDESSPFTSSQHPVRGADMEGLVRREDRGTVSQVRKQAEHKAAKTYVDAGTQTDVVPITSSKLALLQEEQAIARIKHEAEMARMQENMDRTFEHERRMLELRNSFQGPTPQREQSLPTVNGFDPPMLRDVSKQVAEPILAPKDGNPINQNSQGNGSSEPPQEPAHEIRIMGASLNPSIVSQDLPEPDPVGKVLASENPSAILERLLGTPPDPSTQSHVRSTLKALDKPFNNPTPEPKRRPQSAESGSVHIKTSVSPAPANQDHWAPEPRRFPKVNHLTCYFWKNGKCTKSANECSYAHYDTGSVAMAPDSLKKMKRDGSYYRSGGW